MTSLKLVGAALMLSTAFATPVFAQSSAGLPELPGDYAFFSPIDDFSPAVQRRSACTGCCPRSEAADAPAQGPPHFSPLNPLSSVRFKPRCSATRFASN